MREGELYDRYLRPYLTREIPGVQITPVDFTHIPDLIVYDPVGLDPPRASMHPEIFFVEMKIGRYRPDSGRIDLPWRRGQWGWIERHPLLVALCVWFEHTGGTAECRFYPQAVRFPSISDPTDTYVNLIPPSRRSKNGDERATTAHRGRIAAPGSPEIK